MPDAFLHTLFSATELVRFGQVEGQLAGLSALIDEYGPNIRQVFDENPIAEASVTLNDGEIYSLPYVHYARNAFPNPRPFIRHVWIEQGGLNGRPETLDEFYEALRYIKENDVNGNGNPEIGY